jgi:Cu2+-exporting ATPase
VTGIRVSAPTTILSAMTGAAKQGIFIKGGKAMETLASVDAIVFDKTGTLTHGSPFVTDVLPTDAAFTADDVLRLAASAEANLKHPAAKAIVDAAIARGLDVVPPTNMEYMLGQGVYADVDGQALHVGSRRYMNTLGVDITRVAQLVERKMAAANSLVFCALDGRLIGLICYSDPPRGESEMVIRALRERGVKRMVMLTGDNRRAAEAVAGRLGITDIIAEAFPEQKADVVESLRAEGYTVAVIGDGINDSPAFTRANVGISLQHGADVAKETADVILLDGDLRGLPRAIDLSREAIRILNQNVNVIIAPTVIGMAAAAVGLSNPLISTIINNGTTVVTGLNALRPMFPKPHHNEPLPPQTDVAQVEAVVWRWTEGVPQYLTPTQKELP